MITGVSVSQVKTHWTLFQLHTCFQFSVKSVASERITKEKLVLSLSGSEGTACVLFLLGVMREGLEGADGNGRPCWKKGNMLEEAMQNMYTMVTVLLCVCMWGKVYFVSSLIS